MANTFILNATPLIYLAKIGLSSIFEEFEELKLIPPGGFQETIAKGKEFGAPDAFIIEKIVNKEIINVKEPSNKAFLEILNQIPELHDAEAQVIALAKELGGIAILDDRIARQVAEMFNIEVHGTAYLLLRLHYRGKLSAIAVKDAVERMVSVGWRLSAEEYAKIINVLE